VPVNSRRVTRVGVLDERDFSASRNRDGTCRAQFAGSSPPRVLSALNARARHGVVRTKPASHEEDLRKPKLDGGFREAQSNGRAERYMSVISRDRQRRQ
jgi:hypothetical protein